jgi:hypothetical protein
LAPTCEKAPKRQRFAGTASTTTMPESSSAPTAPTASHAVRSTPPLSDEIGVEPAALCQVHEWDGGDTREAASARNAELEVADDGLDHLLDAHR